MKRPSKIIDTQKYDYTRAFHACAERSRNMTD